MLRFLKCRSSTHQLGYRFAQMYLLPCITKIINNKSPINSKIFSTDLICKMEFTPCNDRATCYFLSRGIQKVLWLPWRQNEPNNSGNLATMYLENWQRRSYNGIRIISWYFDAAAIVVLRLVITHYAAKMNSGCEYLWVLVDFGEWTNIELLQE